MLRAEIWAPRRNVDRREPVRGFCSTPSKPPFFTCLRAYLRIGRRASCSGTDFAQPPVWSMSPLQRAPDVSAFPQDEVRRLHSGPRLAHHVREQEASESQKRKEVNNYEKGIDGSLASGLQAGGQKRASGHEFEGTKEDIYATIERKNAVGCRRRKRRWGVSRAVSVVSSLF